VDGAGGVGILPESVVGFRTRNAFARSSWWPRRATAMGYEARKIGETTFLVFADGMVNAVEVREVHFMTDGKVSIGLKSGWLMLRRLASLPCE
jgi:hypothetical protein